MATQYVAGIDKEIIKEYRTTGGRSINLTCKDARLSPIERSNCHGFSTGLFDREGGCPNDSQSMENLIMDDYEARTSGPRIGDIVIWDSAHERCVHSAKVASVNGDEIIDVVHQPSWGGAEAQVKIGAARPRDNLRHAKAESKLCCCGSTPKEGAVVFYRRKANAAAPAAQVMV